MSQMDTYLLYSVLLHPRKKIAKMACFNKAKQLQCMFKPYQGHQRGSSWMHWRNGIHFMITRKPINAVASMHTPRPPSVALIWLKNTMQLFGLFKTSLLGYFRKVVVVGFYKRDSFGPPENLTTVGSRRTYGSQKHQIMSQIHDFDK